MPPVLKLLMLEHIETRPPESAGRIDSSATTVHVARSSPSFFTFSRSTLPSYHIHPFASSFYPQHRSPEPPPTPPAKTKKKKKKPSLFFLDIWVCVS